MAQWSLFVDGQQVQVRTRPEEPGVYNLEWAIGARHQGFTAAHSDHSPMTDAQLQEAARVLLTAAAAPPVAPQRARGVVREWWPEEGWGVIDCPQTPGGCWVHFSAVRVAGYAALMPGQDVVVEWERGHQDGYDHRALGAWPVGQDPVEAAIETESSAVFSSLTLTFDPPAPTG